MADPAPVGAEAVFCVRAKAFVTSRGTPGLDLTQIGAKSGEF
jgi:hypothetical protein